MYIHDKRESNPWKEKNYRKQLHKSKTLTEKHMPEDCLSYFGGKDIVSLVVLTHLFFHP